MPVFEVDGAHYVYTLAGDGPPLVLLHGFTGSQATWEAQRAFFEGQYRVLTVDLLGHGHTRAPYNPARYTMEQAAHDLARLMEHADLGPIHLLGYSMGGRLALYLALHYPHLIRTLILESASPGLADTHERQTRRLADNHLADQIEASGIAWFSEYWAALPLFRSLERLTPAQQATLQQQRLQNDPRGLAASLRGMGTGIQPNLWPDLPRLECPTLLLVGQEDHKFVGIAQQMAQALPQSSLQVIPQAGHVIHLEQPALFHQAILDFHQGRGLP
jgi:2-succinyl-6-hydroxy-2,4-cyclohexadiene-1-carboxylate synthase